MGSFDERIRALEEAVGSGKLVMGHTTHQPYAADEHVERHYKHPRGGRPFYIEDPFHADLNDNLRKLAHNAVVATGSDLVDAAKDIAKSFDDNLRANAPLEFGTLKESGNPWVEDNGVRVWEKPQKARYRSDKE